MKNLRTIGFLAEYVCCDFCRFESIYDGHGDLEQQAIADLAVRMHIIKRHPEGWTGLCPECLKGIVLHGTCNNDQCNFMMDEMVGFGDVYELPKDPPRHFLKKDAEFAKSVEHLPPLEQFKELRKKRALR